MEDETSDYDAILRECWEDHIPNCPNCSRAQPSYWIPEVFWLGLAKELTETTNERKE